MSSNNSLDDLKIYGSQSRSKCGYCKKVASGKTSYGFNCDKMEPENYFNLINRGWRRCGTYYYNNYNDVICCPMFTIRCKTKEFRLRKSQSKVLKKFRNFLISGKEDKIKDSTKINARGDEITFDQAKVNVNSETNNSHSKQPAKDKSQKAKYKRYNLKLLKLRSYSEKIGIDYDTLFNDYQKRREMRKNKNQSKSLAQLLDFSDIKNPMHKFTIKTVLCNPMGPGYKPYINKEHKVYEDYQVAIHKDSRVEVTLSQFSRFLVNGGLRASKSPEFITLDTADNSKRKHFPMGQYHQQYWINDKIIAVGVIDILPSALSSVYLFYDPKYSFLNLGVFSALQEINFVDKMSSYYQNPDFNLYYMGFYIYSCQKMRYKGRYKGSELLCPLTYNWVAIEKCEKILEKVKFSRFADDNAPINDELHGKSDEEISELVKIKFRDNVVPLSFLRVPQTLLAELIEGCKLIGIPTLNKVALNL